MCCSVEEIVQRYWILNIYCTLTINHITLMAWVMREPLVRLTLNNITHKPCYSVTWHTHKKKKKLHTFCIVSNFILGKNRLQYIDIWMFIMIMWMNKFLWPGARVSIYGSVTQKVVLHTIQWCRMCYIDAILKFKFINLSNYILPVLLIKTATANKSTRKTKF